MRTTITCGRALAGSRPHRRTVLICLLLAAAQASADLPDFAGYAQAAAYAPTGPERAFVGPDGRPLPFRSDEEIVEFLLTARVVEQEDVGQGVTKPVRLLLERDGARARAIFHDVDIQRNNVRIGGRVLTDFRDRWSNQVAAYEVARLLGLSSVPPTVERTVGATRGSVSLWVEETTTEGERKARGEVGATPTELRRAFFDMRVFDSVIGNTDRNVGNILYDPEGRMWWIDHTRTFGRDPRLLEPKKVVACSRSLKAALEALTLEKALPRLKQYLSPVEVKAMLKRRDRVLEHLAEQARKRGEKSVWFDHSKAQPDDREPGTR